MNKIKSLFIGMFPMLAMGIAGYGIYQLLTNGLNLIWLGAVMTTLPIMIFIGRVMIFKDMARTSNHFPVLTVIAILGLGLAMFGFLQSAYSSKAEALLALVGFFSFILYNFWYSSLGRTENKLLTSGTQLPKFSVTNNNGEVVSSESFIGNPAIYMFFRGNWCPLCMAQIKELVKKYQEISKTGAKVILISPQPVKNNQILAKKFNVPFLFLTDINNKAAKVLNIEMNNGLPVGMEVLGYSKDTVLPTVIITNSLGKIVYSDDTNNYRIRPEPEEFIKVLENQA